MISGFHGKYAFLSNYSVSDVEFDGIIYPTVEHAFHAAKTHDLTLRAKIYDCRTPGEAKKLGRRLPLRPDWEEVKVKIMTELVRDKFTRNKHLRSLLAATGYQSLVEENSWNDKFWGMCDGEGENHLGQILEEVRSEIKGRG